MTSWTWIRWRNLLVWHVLQDNRTPCGQIRLPQATVYTHVAANPPKGGRACRECLRKRATQVNIPLPGEVRPR